MNPESRFNQRVRQHLFPELEELRYSEEISSNDEMVAGPPASYFRFGLSALENIRLALQVAGVADPHSILDMPCGHGRVLRMLKAAFPSAELTACDLERDAVDFCARTFGATPVYSHQEPAQIELDERFELIWVGSLFTHLGAESWHSFLSFFAAHLAPGGVLVFTTSGRRIADQVRTGGRSFAIHDESALLAAYDGDGFAFQRYVHADDYGISLASPGWICRQLEQHPSLELLMYTEGGWNNNQDVVCVQATRTSDQGPAADMSADDLRREILALGPWHLDVEVTPEVSTGIALEGDDAGDESAQGISFLSPRDGFLDLIRAVYPDGLEGRTVLDCACNCGAYSFWTRELGGSGGFGFDVREHWIKQARFLRGRRTAPSDGITFDVADLYDIPARDPGEFDIAIFKGIFYHLPDPIAGLQIVADRTRELLLLNTATRSGLPDGLLAASYEDVEHPMSGAHGLCWYPTGPDVLVRILASMGFPATRCTFWKRQAQVQPPHGRLEILAARDERLFEHLDRHRPGLQQAALQADESPPA